jgi:hypothetical protein
MVKGGSKDDLGASESIREHPESRPETRDQRAEEIESRDQRREQRAESLREKDCTGGW